MMRQMYYRFLFFILLSTSLLSYSQEAIVGKVQDEVGNSIAYVNVLLLKTVDSTLIKGAITDDNGTFLLESVVDGNYIVSVSMMGFKPKTTEPFEFDGSSKLMLSAIILSEGVELDGVTVSSKKNLYVQKIDRIVINVASSILSAGSSALEILERSPGVLIDRQNSAISLVGKSGVVVMINGKQSYMPTASLVQLLQGMNANNIETIELITTPPANFDAEGNAGFINIVLKEQTDIGLNGSYSLSFGLGNGTVTSDNINVNYRKGRINLFGNYSFQRDAQGQLFEFDRSFINSDEIM